MAVGTIKKIDPKGFGFINQQNGQPDLFFHITGMADRNEFEYLQTSDTVTFEIENGRDGRPRAASVRREQ